MIKKTIHFLTILCSIAAILSCSDDESDIILVCPEPIGNLQAQVDNQFEFVSRFTTFTSTDNNFIEISALESDAFCILIGELGFVLEPRLGNHDLTLDNRDGFRTIGETRFIEWDDDVILGSFDFYNEEPSSMEITSIDENIVEGIFTATYVFEDNGNRFIRIPDTLRFRNVSFRAELFEPLEE